MKCMLCGLKSVYRRMRAQHSAPLDGASIQNVNVNDLFILVPRGDTVKVKFGAKKPIVGSLLPLRCDCRVPELETGHRVTGSTVRVR